LYWSRLPLTATTNSEGWFLLDGLPRERRVALMASDPRFARKFLSVGTLDKAGIDRLDQESPGRPEGKLLADGFTAALQPSCSVRGQVVYGDTGRPVIGASVTIWGRGFYTVTDSRGHFSLEGFDHGDYSVMVKAPEGVDYLAMVTSVSLRTDARLAERNFTLERGLVISGRLREKETGQPLRVPYVSVYYKSEETKAA